MLWYLGLKMDLFKHEILHLVDEGGYRMHFFSSVAKWVPKTVRGCAAPAAENNFILVVGGTDTQQRPSRNPPALIRCCDSAECAATDQSGWFRKDVKLHVEEDHRQLVAWAFSTGPYLGQKGNFSVEPTWEVRVFLEVFQQKPNSHLFHPLQLLPLDRRRDGIWGFSRGRDRFKVVGGKSSENANDPHQHRQSRSDLLTTSL
ncbi:hypothetical protein B0J14DRAFT_643414 [Halenospora varia]|nr:hypothetical protein B0J14DRAFT_643414 [Halenospora varia]